MKTGEIEFTRITYEQWADFYSMKIESSRLVDSKLKNLILSLGKYCFAYKDYVSAGDFKQAMRVTKKMESIYRMSGTLAQYRIEIAGSYKTWNQFFSLRERLLDYISE